MWNNDKEREHKSTSEIIQIDPGDYWDDRWYNPLTFISSIVFDETLDSCVPIC